MSFKDNRKSAVGTSSSSAEKETQRQLDKVVAMRRMEIEAAGRAKTTTVQVDYHLHDEFTVSQTVLAKRADRELQALMAEIAKLGLGQVLTQLQGEENKTEVKNLTKYFGRKEAVKFIAAKWAISHKAANKLMHALNGNIYCTEVYGKFVAAMTFCQFKQIMQKSDLFATYKQFTAQSVYEHFKSGFVVQCIPVLNHKFGGAEAVAPTTIVGQARGKRFAMNVEARKFKVTIPRGVRPTVTFGTNHQIAKQVKPKAVVPATARPAAPPRPLAATAKPKKVANRVVTVTKTDRAQPKADFKTMKSRKEASTFDKLAGFSVAQHIGECGHSTTVTRRICRSCENQDLRFESDFGSEDTMLDCMEELFGAPAKKVSNYTDIEIEWNSRKSAPNGASLLELKRLGCQLCNANLSVRHNFTQLVERIMYKWGISQKKANKLVHALNGNIFGMFPGPSSVRGGRLQTSNGPWRLPERYMFPGNYNIGNTSNHANVVVNIDTSAILRELASLGALANIGAGLHRSTNAGDPAAAAETLADIIHENGEQLVDQTLVAEHMVKQQRVANSLAWGCEPQDQSKPPNAVDRDENLTVYTAGKPLPWTVDLGVIREASEVLAFFLRAAGDWLELNDDHVREELQVLKQMRDQGASLVDYLKREGRQRLVRPSVPPQQRSPGNDPPTSSVGLCWQNFLVYYLGQDHVRVLGVNGQKISHVLPITLENDHGTIELREKSWSDWLYRTDPANAASFASQWCVDEQLQTSFMRLRNSRVYYRRLADDDPQNHVSITRFPGCAESDFVTFIRNNTLTNTVWYTTPVVCSMCGLVFTGTNKELDKSVFHTLSKNKSRTIKSCKNIDKLHLCSLHGAHNCSKSKACLLSRTLASIGDSVATDTSETSKSDVVQRPVVESPEQQLPANILAVLSQMADTEGYTREVSLTAPPNQYSRLLLKPHTEIARGSRLRVATAPGTLDKVFSSGKDKVTFAAVETIDALSDMRYRVSWSDTCCNYTGLVYDGGLQHLTITVLPASSHLLPFSLVMFGTVHSHLWACDSPLADYHVVDDGSSILVDTLLPVPRITWRIQFKLRYVKPKEVLEDFGLQIGMDDNITVSGFSENPQLPADVSQHTPEHTAIAGEAVSSTDDHVHAVTDNPAPAVDAPTRRPQVPGPAADQNTNVGLRYASALKRSMESMIKLRAGEVRQVGKVVITDEAMKFFIGNGFSVNKFKTLWPLKKRVNGKLTREFVHPMNEWGPQDYLPVYYDAEGDPLDIQDVYADVGSVNHVSYEVTESSSDWPHFTVINNVVLHHRQQLMTRLTGGNRNMRLSNHAKKAVNRLAKQLATADLLRYVTMSELNVKAVETGRLGAAARVFTEWLRAISYSVNIDAKLLNLKRLRLDDIEKLGHNFVDKVFIKFVEAIRSKNTCTYSVDCQACEDGRLVCGFTFCDDSCKTRLPKKAKWLNLCKQNGWDPKAPPDNKSNDMGDPTSQAEVNATLKNWDTDINKLINLTLGISDEEMSDDEFLDAFAAARAFGLYMTAGSSAPAMNTADTLGKVKEVRVGAKADQDAVRKRKLENQLKSEEAKLKKINMAIDKITAQLKATGRSSEAKAGEGAKEVVASAATYLDGEQARGLTLSAQADDASFSDLMSALEQVRSSSQAKATGLRAGSGDAQITDADLNKRMTLSVKEINNNRLVDGKMCSDNLCWAHSYSYLDQKLKNPDLADNEIKRVDPSLDVYIDNGLNARDMIEKYGMDPDSTAFYLNADFGGLTSGWYGSDPLSSDYRFYLSEQTGQGGQSFLHCEPIVDVQTDAETEVTAMGLQAGSVAEGLVLVNSQALPNPLLAVDSVESDPSTSKPQLSDIGGRAKFEFPKGQFQNGLASLNTPYGRLFQKYVTPHAFFKHYMSQKWAKARDFDYFFNNNWGSLSTTEMISPSTTETFKLRSGGAHDRITFYTPNSMLSYEHVDPDNVNLGHRFVEIPVDHKFYVSHVNPTLHTGCSFEMAEVLALSKPKDTMGFMQLFDATSAYKDLALNRLDLAKFAARMDETRVGTPVSRVPELFSALAEIVMRENRPDLGIMSNVMGVVPNVDPLHSVLQFNPRAEFNYAVGGRDHPVVFPLHRQRVPLVAGQVLDDTSYEMFPRLPFYNDEGRTIPCAVVPEWFGFLLFGSGNFHGDSASDNLMRAVLRFSANGNRSFAACGGFALIDVEDFIRTSNMHLTQIQCYNDAGNVVAGAFVDLLTPTTDWHAAGNVGLAPWGTVNLLNGLALPAGTSAQQTYNGSAWAFTQAAALGNTRFSMTRIADGGTGDCDREALVKMGFMRYALLPEFKNIGDLLTVRLDYKDIIKQSASLAAQIVTGLPGPLFSVTREVNMATPTGGFVSYSEGEGVKVNAQRVTAAIMCNDNIQQLMRDTRKRAVVIVITGTEDRTFESNITLLSNARNIRQPVAGQRTTQALGLIGGLSKFLLPIKTESWDSAEQSLTTGYAAAEGPGGHLWDVPQNITHSLEDRYLTLTPETFNHNLKSLAKWGATDEEYQQALILAATFMGQQSLLPVVGQGYSLYAPHVARDADLRDRLVGQRAIRPLVTGDIDLQPNAVDAARTDLVNAHMITMNAIGMRAYHTNTGETHGRNRQVTFGTVHGMLDFGLKMGLLKPVGTSEWPGFNYFETRAINSAIINTSRGMVYSFNAVCHHAGVYPADIMEARQTDGRFTNDEFLRDCYTDSELHPLRMIEQVFNFFAPQKMGTPGGGTFTSIINFAVENRHSGPVMDTVRRNYINKILATVPRRANPLYTREENTDQFIVCKPEEIGERIKANGVLWEHWLRMEGLGSNTTEPALSTVPWKFADQNGAIKQPLSELRMAKKDTTSHFTLSAQMMGCEERIWSFVEMVPEDIRAHYGVVDQQTVDDLVEFIRTNGTPWYVKEYRYEPLVRGSEAGWSLITTNGYQMFSSLHQVPRIMTRTIAANVLNLNNSEERVAAYMQAHTEMGFSL
nr:putative coat protein [Rhizoctonia zeae megatotivirus 2]